MIAFCKQCGKRYQVDAAVIKNSTARFNCRYCGRIVFIEKHRNTSNTSGTYSDDPLDSPVVGIKEVNDSAKFEPAPDPSTKIRFSRNTKKYGFSLVTKIIILMLSVSLIPFCTIWWIINREFNLQVRHDTENLIDQVASDLAINVNEWIDKNIRILKTISELEGMMSMDPYQQLPLLKTVQEQYPWMYLVFVTNMKGMNIARSDGKTLLDYSDRRYFKDIVTGNELSWQVVIGKSSKKPALVLAVPIIREGITVGILANAMTIDDISRRIANWRRGETGFAFLVDETGKVISHQNGAFILKQKDLSDHPLVRRFAEGRTGMLYFKDENGRSIVGNVHGTRHGWALSVQQNTDEAFRSLERTRRFAAVFFVMTIFVVILISCILGRAIVLPIRRLSEAAERISVGELDVEINISGNDEISALGRAILEMQNSIRLTMERFRQRK